MSNKIIYQIVDSYGEMAHYSLEDIMEEHPLYDYAIGINFWDGDISWTESVKGKRSAVLVDDGNGITIQFYDSGKEILLDHSQLEEVACLIDYYNNHLDKSVSTKVRKFKELEEE